MNGTTQWANAVTTNVANTVNQLTYNPITHHTQINVENIPAVGAYAYDQGNAPYLGSFQSFLNSSFVQGGNTYYYYQFSLDQLRSSWGIDTTTDTAWAVLDVGSGMFAVVPEPASIRLLVAGMMSLAVGFWWRRRARVQRLRIGTAS